MANPKAPIYTLPHGIEVIGEYPPNAHTPYWRVRIRPHPFFPGKTEQSGGILLHRSRVFLAAKLGRSLTRNDHAHHGPDGKTVDTFDNLELMDAGDHNRHHKIGASQSDNAKRKIAESVKRAYKDGRMDRKRYLKGSEQSQAKLDEKKVRHIRSSSESAYSLAKQYSVSKQVVLAVRNRKTWKHIK